MKKIKFNKNYPEFFHLNFEYETHSLFPELDWLLINYKINKLADIFKIEVLAFVMMTNHCHLLLKSKNKNENYFSEKLIQELQCKGELINDSLVEPITNMTQFLNTYKYIYRNPVEAGIVSRCEDYKFSSLNGLLGKSFLETQIIDPLAIIQNPKRILLWLNQNDQQKYFTSTYRSAASLIHLE